MLVLSLKTSQEANWNWQAGRQADGLTGKPVYWEAATPKINSHRGLGGKRLCSASTGFIGYRINVELQKDLISSIKKQPTADLEQFKEKENLMRNSYNKSLKNLIEGAHSNFSGLFGSILILFLSQLQCTMAYQV